MKKFFFNMMAVTIIAVVCAGFASCGGDDGDDGGGSSSYTPSNNSGDAGNTPNANNYNNNSGNATQKSISVSGTKDGHNYVDLGLSVLWATCNIGAYSPESSGSYFTWSNNGNLKTLDICGTQNDNATAVWRGEWRTPTLWEMKELVDKCTWKVTSLNGTKGSMATGPNGNKIFFPFSGHRFMDDTEIYGLGETGKYWTSIAMPKGSVPFSAYGSMLADRATTSWSLLIESDGYVTFNVDVLSSEWKYTVRPVFGNIVRDMSGNGNGGTSSGDAPYITNFNSTATKNSITVKFMSSEKPTSATIYYGEYSASKVLSSTISIKQISATATGLKSGTKYYFKCIVRNENGSSTSAEYPVMTNY